MLKSKSTMGTITTPAPRWTIAKPAPTELFEAFPEYPRPIVQMLFNRGVTADEAITNFLDPVYPRDLHDPLALGGVKEAVEIIKQSIADSERIVIHGDYDADGLTATALLLDVLTQLGANVSSFIPNRYEEGYGVAAATLKKLRAEKADLVITVDCGISSAVEIAAARKAGLKVIVTDHHTAPKNIPKAEAVINPNQPGDTYPNKALTGAGVAFKLAQALLLKYVSDEKKRDAAEKWLLDLVAIGTVADMADLRGENRTLVKYGLVVLKQSRRPGLRHLLRTADIAPEKLTARSIGYSIGPRLNAPGRLGHANEALALLTTHDDGEARGLAFKLDTYNRERRQVTSGAVEEVEQQLPTLTDNDRIIVIDGAWQSGVVGLIAGQLSREYSRPAVVIERGETISRGSVRSIPGFNVAKALQAHQSLLQTYGGHAGAGGFSISTNKLERFRIKLEEFARQTLSARQLRPTLEIEAELLSKDLNWELLDRLSAFEPFGIGNTEPNLLLTVVIVQDISVVGQDASHLKLVVQPQGGERLTVLAFGMAKRRDELAVGKPIDLVGRPVTNEFNNQKSLEWHASDFRTT
ncbi:single-stranded-DNA-specific exonuclease RecJ [Patescibacteria group bacterium]|nr:single-stranded-DNA-specific exonuclease RecJ [Patescibacteria group bacterium]